MDISQGVRELEYSTGTVGSYDDTILRMIDQLAVEAHARGIDEVLMFIPKLTNSFCRYKTCHCYARPVSWVSIVTEAFGLPNSSYALGCWDTDAYVAKYKLPTTNCVDGVPDSSTFYTNPSAVADVRLRFLPLGPRITVSDSLITV